MSKESLASEGDKLFEKGDSYTKRTFTRWSPDWGEASVHFEKAATKYRAAGQTYQARLARALIRAAEAYENLNSLNSSAKCLTQALKILVTLNDEELRTEAAQLCKKAANLYQANGQPDKAAQTLVQGAGFFGKQDAKVALKYYMEALTIYAEESREALAHDTYKKGIAYAVKFQEFDMAITLLENQAKIYQKQGSGNLYVNYLGIIVIYCYLKQCEKARTALNSFDK
jgi:tetratricopeptide (TPR) repeat protein